MNSFKDDFIFRLNTQPNIGTIMRYNLLRTNTNVPAFFFVEGRSDELFYGNLKNEKTVKPPAEYISGLTNKSIDSESGLEGKTAVLEAFSVIKQDAVLNRGISKCVFLIDRDYDGINNSKIKIALKDKKKFTVTPYHSLECFFLDDINLKTIFEFFGIHGNLEFFCALLDSFSKESGEYFALQGSVTYCHNINLKIDYRKTHLSAEIFAFKFPAEDRYEFNRQYLEVETTLMKKAVLKNELARQKFETIYTQIRESCLNIHGHTLFNFLTEYLFQVHGKRFAISIANNNFVEIIGKIVIDMPIVFGDGSTR